MCSLVSQAWRRRSGAADVASSSRSRSSTGLRELVDGRRFNCRACNAAWHADNKAHHNALIHARNQRVHKGLYERIWSYLAEHPCADCGEGDVAVLEFDRLRDKLHNVGTMVGSDSSGR